MNEAARSGATPVAVHQFVPALIPRDATGIHTLMLRQVLRQAGWHSEIFAEATHDELMGESIRVEEYPAHARPDDVLVYQFSTSSMVAGFLAARPERLVLDYHNITGPEHYLPWEPATARRASDALVQLEQLAPKAVLGLADSAFNERDLVRAGCPRTTVVPVLFDHDRSSSQPDQRVARRLRAAKGHGGTDLLFVGRLVPSKAQHELIKGLWAFRRLYDPLARLHLVGSTPSGRYLNALRAFIEDLGLTGAVRITGEVSDGALAAHYEEADVYLSLSIHEGFGVPLVEAMKAGVPVVALAAGAVSGTVADAGLLLERAEPSYVAAVLAHLVAHPELRARLVTAGHRRCEELSAERAGRLAVDAIATVAGAPPVLHGVGAGATS